MNNILILLSACLLTLSCNSSDTQGNNSAAETSTLQTSSTDSASFTTINWLDPVQQDLGTIKEGQTPEITWRFTNTGTKPLVIENASATCGCTIAEKPQQPIMPGEEGTIKAKFTSEGRLGPNNKQVVVSANTKGDRMHTLGFTVVVEGKK
ncbi:MAG TPA: DUF1573 domain-containing protein [Chitinophagaceae bacterium]|jgi:hypothetical protein|nr:DUF1573 domain-containing protein [Chitinophagaceae bacterium]